MDTMDIIIIIEDMVDMEDMEDAVVVDLDVVVAHLVDFGEIDK